MNRDQDIQKIFEIADDSLQGVLGYHLYVIAMQRNVDINKIWDFLPDERIPLTFSWDRFYQKQDLTNAFRNPIFDFYQSRISLIAITNVFEVALANFIICLNQKGHQQSLKGKELKNDLPYKKCIVWAYLESVKCDIGDKDAVKRLPKTFGMIDNARRIRNLIVHNHGLFSKKYEEDVIEGIPKEVHAHYQHFKKYPHIPTPVILTPEEIIDFNRAHIEVLHILHNYIQKEHFGVQKPYVYREEKKGIEWNKVLWGDAKVKIVWKTP